MNNLIKHINSFFLLTIVIGFLGCSTEKNSVVNRTYHNVTARYNGYFNAKESIKEGKKKLEESFEEDYNNILPIHIYGTESQARSIYPQMDRAIEKCSNVINNHSMYIKKEEYCKWVDDSYFLIGKANFYKQNYEKAEEMLKYVANEYKEDPIHYDAMLWLARTYIADGRFSLARGLLTKCDADEEFPQKKLAELKSVKAEMYLKQENYQQAAKEVKNAIEYTKSRKDKARLTYILAQVYEKAGDSNKAVQYYHAVLDLNPDYKMAFYANIHAALAYEGSNSSQIKSKLLEMAKDEKNEEFFDQIYYALAELELKENNKEKAIDYLQLSYEKSISNYEQKSKSFLRLADIYFKDKNYVKAQAYYDSTVTIIDKSIPEYSTILERRNSLTRLVKDILIVQKEDSLQQLASLSKKEQEAIVDDIIREIIEEEEQKKAEAEANALQQQNTPTNTQINSAGSTEWYFYNPSTVAFGKSEFKKKWGNRKLEDNWRRKNKSSTTSNDFDDYGELESLEDEDTTATSSDYKNPRYYLQNIPNTKKKMSASHNKIISALYDKGLVYKEKLKDDKQATATFEELVTRYDTSKFHASAYYQLYRLYSTSGNSVKAEQYKNKVLKEFPNSQYAQLIVDPGFLDKSNNKASEVSKFYETTYNLYKSKKFNAVIENANKAEKQYKSSELLPKFAYLKAQSIGETDSVSAYKEALENLVKTFSGTPEANLAKKTLAYISKDLSKIEDGNSDDKKANYTFKADAKHHFIIILPSSGVDINKAKIALSDFNRKYFKADKLKISSTVLSSGERIIVIKTFNNVFKAMDYYKAFDENKDLLKTVREASITTYPISLTNYPDFYKNSDIKGYQSFFDVNYK